MKKLGSLLCSLCAAAALAVVFAASAFAQTPAFDKVSDAADYLRAQMVRRSAEVSFVMDVPYDAMGDLSQVSLQQALDDWFERFRTELFDAVFRHTCEGREGDYLRAHYDGYSLTSMSISVDYSARALSLPLTWNVRYSTTAAQEAQVDAAVKNTLGELGLDGKTDYEKIRAINDYICENVVYDYEHLHDEGYGLKYTAYAAIINKTAVCEGYAALFYRMALDAGLDARLITGVTDKNELHAWNIVRIGDRWYQLDATWNASLGDDRYFLRGSANFPDHTADERFRTAAFAASYPIASADYTLPASDCVHAWTGRTVTRQPGCEVPGVITWTCAKCGDAKTEEIPAAGHRTERTAPIPATCTTQGRIPYFVCCVCGELFADADAVYPITAEETFRPALGHDYTDWLPLDGDAHQRICRNDPAHNLTEKHRWDGGKTAAGGKTVYTCTVCGAKKEGKTEVPSSSSGAEIVITLPTRKPEESTTKKPEEPTTKKPEEPTTKKTEESTTKKTEESTIRTPGAFVPGDLDENGEVEVADARYVLRAAVGLENYPRGGRKFLAADVDGNGSIEVVDARMVLRAAVGLEDLKKKY